MIMRAAGAEPVRLKPGMRQMHASDARGIEIHRCPPRGVLRAPRLALHAEKLTFKHPLTHTELNFEVALPPELQAFLEAQRQHCPENPAS